MQKTLYSLIELQEIDLKLDRVEEEKGDLPAIVDRLKQTLEEKERLLEEQKGRIKKLKIETKTIEIELSAQQEQLKKYESQLYQVKTNKEYDAIANETENVKKKNKELEDRIIENTEESENLIKSNEELESEIDNLKREFEENSEELKEKISASSYKRIRDAKRGLALAYCNGGVCSGCYSFIPPQKVVEIRSMKRLFQCESCGRILMWDKNQE